MPSLSSCISGTNSLIICEMSLFVTRVWRRLLEGTGDELVNSDQSARKTLFTVLVYTKANYPFTDTSIGQTSPYNGHFKLFLTV